MFKIAKVCLRKYTLMVKSPFTYGRLLPLALMVVSLATLSAVPVSASSGLTVNNALILANVNPGQVLTQKITVNIDSADPAADVIVQVTGVAQTLNGSYVLLDASQDTGPYSARQFVSIDKNSFHVEPGGSQDIIATVQIPQNVGAGGRYAMINIVTAPVTGAGVSMREAVNVPVYLTIKGSQIINTGKITKVGTDDVISGNPINMFVDFQNTGNCHFKVQGDLTIKDPQGQTTSTISMPVTSSSIVPGMSRRLKASFTPNGDLAPGTYSFEANVTLSDGSSLDKASGTFTVKSAYTPPPTTNASNPAPTNANNPVSSTNAVSPITPVNPVAQTGPLGISWAWAGIIIGAILVVGILIMVVMIRRVPAKKE